MNPNTFLYKKINLIKSTCKPKGFTKIIYTEKKIAPPNIYHVSLSIKEGNSLYISEIGKGFELEIYSSEVNEIELPNTSKTIENIIALEDLYSDETYIFGFNDCRHHCNRMMNAIYQLSD